MLATVAGFVLTVAALQGLWIFNPPAAKEWPIWSGELSALWAGAQRNLQGSVVPFLMVLACYLWQVVALRAALSRPQPALDKVLRREQLLDLCAHLFFGIGVVWTAIGMRGALLHALGDAGSVEPGSGIAVLERLVDGGILLALSTTIVGGFGGYLMRCGKSLLCGHALAALYLRESQRAEQQHLAVLQRIESRLAGGAERHARDPESS